MKIAEILAQEKKVWTRSAPADLYYRRDPENPLRSLATDKLDALCSRFQEECADKIIRLRGDEHYKGPKLKRILKRCKGCCDERKSVDSNKDSESDDEVRQETTTLGLIEKLSIHIFIMKQIVVK